MAVSKEVKETIAITVDEVFTKMNRISWIDRQKAMTDAAFQNTEKLLYSFNALKEHVENEQEYFEMAFKCKSGSVVRYQTSRSKQDNDQIIKDRQDSYNRSLSDLKRIRKALEKMKDKKGYKVIELRYLTKKSNDETYTYEEIADMLAGKYGYSENLNEKTVRLQKNKMVREIAVLLFGSDAI